MKLSHCSFFASTVLFLAISGVGRGAAAEPLDSKQSSDDCTSFGTFHLSNAPAPLRPSQESRWGEMMLPTGTSNTGFSPTRVIDREGFTWYSPPMTGVFNPGTYTMNLWTNEPSDSAPVMIRLGVESAEGCDHRGCGTFRVVAGASTVDVSTSGTGNHVTQFPLLVSDPIVLDNQRLVIQAFLVGPADVSAPTMAYNGGLDFDSNLVTTGSCSTPNALAMDTSARR